MVAHIGQRRDATPAAARSAAVRRSALRAASRRAGPRAPPAPRSSSSPCRRRSGIRAGTPCRTRTAHCVGQRIATPSRRRRAVRSVPGAACWRARASDAPRRASPGRIGHITPASNARQAPLLLHISTAPSMPPSGPGYADQSSLGAKSVSGRVSGAVTEQRAVVHARRADDAAWVQHVGGSNASFTVSKARTMRAPNIVSWNSLRAMPSPCSPLWRAFVFAHQGKGFLGDGAHCGDVGGILHVQHRPHVQAADRGVRVPGALGAVARRTRRSAVRCSRQDRPDRRRSPR